MSRQSVGLTDFREFSLSCSYVFAGRSCKGFRIFERYSIPASWYYYIISLAIWSTGFLLGKSSWLRVERCPKNRKSPEIRRCVNHGYLLWKTVQSGKYGQNRTVFTTIKTQAQNKSYVSTIVFCEQSNKHLSSWHVKCFIKKHERKNNNQEGRRSVPGRI